MSQFFGGLVNGQVVLSEVPGSGIYAGTTQQFPAVPARASYSNGTAADLVNGVAVLALTLVASTPQTIDLAALVDFFTGATITVARLRFAMFKVSSGTDGAFTTISPGATNGFTGIGAGLNVYPGTSINDGFCVWNAPNTTAAAVGGSTHILKCDPGTTAQTLLCVFGTASV